MDSLYKIDKDYQITRTINNYLDINNIIYVKDKVDQVVYAYTYYKAFKIGVWVIYTVLI